MLGAIRISVAVALSPGAADNPEIDCSGRAQIEEVLELGSRGLAPELSVPGGTLLQDLLKDASRAGRLSSYDCVLLYRLVGFVLNDQVFAGTRQ